MKSILTILLVLNISAKSQLTSLVVRNDTLFNFNPSTGAYTQLTRSIPPQVGQSGNILSTNGSSFQWSQLKTINTQSLVGSGDITITGNDVDWADIMNKPATFTPSAHSHVIGDVTGLQVELDGKQNSLGFTAVPDTRTINGKQLNGNISITAGDVGLGNVTNESKSTMFTTPTFTGVTTTTGSLGYSGAATGGVVSQNGNKSNAVTINKICGQITMVNSALAAAAEVSFVVNNNLVAATDAVIVNIQSVGTVGSYLVSVSAVANGSFTISLSNVSAGSLSQALVLNFAVIKGVNN